jgi:ABC-2 type transport system ATP-binding protein
METMMTTNAIEVRGLSRASGTFRLDAVDLVLPVGTVLGLVGPNGAGKTTTIRSVVGLIDTEPGSVTLFDGLRPGHPDVAQRLGVVLDLPFVGPEWRVDRIGRRLGGFYEHWDEAVFHELLRRFDVPTTTKVGGLSRGQGVKLSVATALAHRPELLVLDEPTSGLDPVSRAELLDVLREFMTDPSHSLLFSTHTTADLDALADRIQVLGRGRVVWSGTVEALHEEFAVVRGTDRPDPAVERAVIGLRLEHDRWDGLIRLADSALFGPDVVVDDATVDDVVVFSARHHDRTEVTA